MGDGGDESLAVAVSEHARFTTMIRRSVRGVCDDVLARVPADTDARRDIRDAGEKLGDLLVAQAGTMTRPAGDSPTAASPAGEMPPSIGDADDRARAFRAMAGVGASRGRR